MKYDEELDARLTLELTPIGAQRRKMFGGLCFLVRGNMLCGVWKDYLILRLGEVEGKKALIQPHVVPFDITGKPMKGWVMVERGGFEGDKLNSWLAKAEAFVATLPAK